MGDEMSNDDIDALLAGGGAEASPPEEEKTTVSNDDIDALFAGGAATDDTSAPAEEKTTVSNDDIDALFAGGAGGDTDTTSTESTTVSNEDIDALLAGGTSVGDAPAPEEQTTISNDDMDALLGTIDGMTDSSADAPPAETLDQKILDLVESATSVGCAAWQTLLNKEVSQNITKTELGNPAAVLEAKDLIGATIPITGSAKGTLYLTYTKTSASRVIGLMLMESEEDIAARADKEFGPEEIDAFGEAINQWGGAVSQAWRDALGCDISFGPCELSYGESFMQLLLPGKGSGIVYCDFSIEGSDAQPAWICLDSKLIDAWSPAAAPPAEEPASSPSTPAPSGANNVEEPSDILGENIDAILSIEVPVRVIIADKKMNMVAVRDIAQGSIIEFDKNCEEILDIYIGNQMMGRGEVVIRRERFGIQIKEVLTLEERIRMLGV